MNANKEMIERLTRLETEMQGIHETLNNFKVTIEKLAASFQQYLTSDGARNARIENIEKSLSNDRVECRRKEEQIRIEITSERIERERNTKFREATQTTIKNFKWLIGIVGIENFVLILKVFGQI